MSCNTTLLSPCVSVVFPRSLFCYIPVSLDTATSVSLGQTCLLKFTFGSLSRASHCERHQNHRAPDEIHSKSFLCEGAIDTRHLSYVSTPDLYLVLGDSTQLSRVTEWHNCDIDDPFSLLTLWKLSRIATPTETIWSMYCTIGNSTVFLHN